MGAGSSVRLGRVFGIRVGATPSWFFVLFLLIYLLTGYFGDVLSGSGGTAFTVAVAGALLFEVSLVLHELGHALAARRHGITTSGIDLWFFGGLAKLEREPDTPGREFVVAAAGPAVTVALAAACVAAGALSGHGGEFFDVATLQTVTTTPAIALLAFLFSINVGLFAFNIVPAYPLDGGRIARAVAWRLTGDRHRGTRFAGRLGQAFAYVLIGFGVFLLFRGDSFDGVWFAVLGWFMAQSARAAVLGTAFQERIDGVTVGDLMDPSPVTLPAATTALEAQEEWFHRYGWAWFPVVAADGAFLGLLHAEQADAAVTSGQPALAVGELLDGPDGGGFRVARDAGLAELLDSAGLRANGALMVVDPDGRLCGVVTVEQVRRALAAAAPGRA